MGLAVASASAKASYAQSQEDLVSAYLKSASAGGVAYTGLMGGNAASITQAASNNLALIIQH